ncbi:calcium-binding protein, partial [Malikia granosa]|uniref:calcium-binding protein n=1 Tax=Malikia granosa TaxID=263067 RepID=UPI0011B039D5
MDINTTGTTANGSSGNDNLVTGPLDDTLYGFDGNDTLDGGAGNDLLVGGDGVDTYVFGMGSGHDTINAGDGWYDQPGVAPVDKVQLGAGIAPADFTLARVGSDLVLRLPGGNDSLTLQSYYDSGNYYGYSRVQLQFANGTLWGEAEIAAQLVHVDGSLGDDYLYGTIATDSMQGGQGNDWIYAGDNADTLLGGEGHDSLFGEQGNDLLDGGSGNDSLAGGDGADTYLFGTGSGRDTINASDSWYDQPGVAPVDTVRLGAGIAPADVKLSRVGGDLVLSLAGSNDSLTVQGYYYNYGNDYYGYTRVQLQFADGTLWGIAEIAAQLIHVDGSPGNDGLYGTVATDSMQGGQGNDWIYAGDNADTLLGGAGHDSLYGEQGDDLLDGGAGNDWLAGGDGADSYVFGIGSGHDTVDASDSWYDQQGVAPVDTLRIGAGIAPADLTLARVGNHLVLRLAGGNDSLTVQDYYSYSNNYYGYARIQLQFANGTLWSAAEIAAQIIHVDGTPGNDGLYGTVATDSIQGGQGNDQIWAGDNADTLLGGEGHDSLFGEQGNDLLDGGSGNDSLWGGDGADAYVFGIGSGHDTVYASDGWYGQTPIAPIDTVRLGTGIAPADLTLTRAGSDLVLSLAGGNDSLTVQGYYSYNANYDGNSRIQLQFASGTVWGNAQIAAQIIHVEGSPGNEDLYGTTATDSMQGGQGNDWMVGADNADTLRGGDGHDSLLGGDGNDLLDGGTGNDSLIGGNGADTYVFGIGSGHDRIDVSDDWYSNPVGVAPVDTVQLGAGIAPADFALARSGDDLVLSLPGGDDSFTVQGYYSYLGDFYGYTRVQLQFANGTLWDQGELWAMAGGLQRVEPPAGQYIYGTAGDDDLTGGVGADTLYGEAGNDQLDGGEGNDWLAGSDGTDIYLFGIGSGQDTVDASDGWQWGSQVDAPAVDTVQLGQGILPADLKLARVGDDLVLSLAGSDDSLTLYRYYSSYPVEYGYSRVQLQFADGTVWDANDIAAQVIHVDGSPGNDGLYGTVATDSVQGGEGNDLLDGLAGNDTLAGGEGHDSLYGGAGDDRLDGGEGNDYSAGDDGADTYVFGIGSGHDTVSAYDYWYLTSQENPAPIDTVQFGAGIAPADLELARVGSDLVLSLAGGGDSLTVQGYYTYDSAYYGQSRVQLQFANGTLWGAADIAAQLIHVDGSPGNDGLYGTVATDSMQGGQGNDWIWAGDKADTLLGGEGHDSLFGEQGNDLLDGGAGNDSLMGGDGADSYVFGIGSGRDTVDASDSWYGQAGVAPVDTVRIGAGIAPADLKLSRVGGDLVLSPSGGSDSLTVQGYYYYDNAYYGYTRVQLQFADGTLWGAAEISAQVIHVDGTPGNDGLNGTIATDSMQGGQGNDQISAGDNADTLLGGAGHDSLYGDQGNDLLDGGAGNDSLMGGDGSDSYVFGIGS